MKLAAMHAARMSGRRASGISGASDAFASDMAERTVIANSCAW
jgi:3-methyladenine DNA glycosylase/8-oxoguanine DNA glycosylase